MMPYVKLPGVGGRATPEWRVSDDALAPGVACINLDEPKEITSRQTAIERGKQQAAEILDAPAHRQTVANLHAMQVDQKKLERFAGLPFGPATIFDEEMAEVKIAMIGAGLVEGAGDFGDAFEQRALEQFLAAAGEAAPIPRQRLEMYHVIERLGDQERLDVRGLSSAFALAGDDGCGDSQSLDEVDGVPFRAGADDGSAALKPVLPDLAPAAAAMDLDEKTAPAD